jgi:glycosyltransferase involved in cell wall biosynthesis
MSSLRSRAGVAKTRLIRRTASAVARVKRRPHSYRPGVTVVTVNWNSLPFLRAMVAAVRAMSPPDIEIVVVDNASTDGSREWLRTQPDIRVIELPVNVGHGVALDLAVPTIDTEYLAVLDVDAFPISDQWLQQSIAALEAGAKAAGARMHRNFVHPCFLVTYTKVLHDYGLTFRPVGSLAKLSTEAPLFLDVAEALSQRLIVKFGGGQALHFFDITSTRGTGVDGAVFGGLVYHNMFATQGKGRDDALRHWHEALATYHPTLDADG